MENVSNKSEQERLQSYANDLYSKVNFLFQRRRVGKVDGELNICLNDTEIKFVTPAFIDNFIDAPDIIEITLINDDNPASDRGVLVITEHEDQDNVYSTLYTICAHNNDVGAFITKDVNRSPSDFRPSEDAAYKIEKIYEDAPLDESERAMLIAMITKL